VVSPAIALTMAVAAASLVRRFRRSRGSERQQLRWLAMAYGLLTLLLGGSYAEVVLGLGQLPRHGLLD
jgi:hypothetical protein